MPVSKTPMVKRFLAFESAAKKDGCTPKKIDSGELEALKAISKDANGKLDASVVPEFVRLYREGTSSFQSEGDVKKLGELLAAEGAVPGADWSQLPKDEKIAAMFIDYTAGEGDDGFAPDLQRLSRGFSSESVRLKDVLSGDSLARAMDGYHSARQRARNIDSDLSVDAIKQNGQIRGFMLSADNNTDSNFQKLYDEKFNPLGEWEYSD